MRSLYSDLLVALMGLCSCIGFYFLWNPVPREYWTILMIIFHIFLFLYAMIRFSNKKTES